MKVLIPHKDVIFLLTKIQQKFIFDFNNFSDFPTKNLKNTKARIIPLFPLWAFFDDSDFADFADSEKKFNFKNLCKSQIEKIDFDFENNKFYFLIKLDFLSLETDADFAKTDADVEKNSHPKLELGESVKQSGSVNKKIETLQIPKQVLNDIFFQKDKKSKFELKIYFAQKLNAQSENFSLKEFTKKFSANFFPIKMNVFKFGNLSEKNSLYQVFDEKWIKISSK